MCNSTRLAALKQNSLWDFALDFYARPEVEAACLCLQDEAKVDVCELLFHAWLYRHGLEAEPEALAAERQARTRWQQEVTSVLRDLRRTLKGRAQTSHGIAKLRATIKEAEMLAERENLQRWQQWALTSEISSPGRLKEVAQWPCDSARWLQLPFFSPKFHSLSVSRCEEHSTVKNAWEVLGGQLDRLTRAR
ncbi:TIGR02444 family protein [Halomonas llamarensis]|uniref:TIGR02444 family protein n=1 Tax=Halomonas llamarensis TaxID=2945104 RepID=A0ABT0SLK6_9GAMM|nr:TIGR02444 family protein [Halomonas llamarensis]MCL7928695.1 TIGR02444 family protein [Halomonas llamarensis]